MKYHKHWRDTELTIEGMKFTLRADKQDHKFHLFKGRPWSVVKMEDGSKGLSEPLLTITQKKGEEIIKFIELIYEEVFEVEKQRRSYDAFDEWWWDETFFVPPARR